MSNVRPATSKARGICKYYNTPRGCFAGKSCKFLHGAGEQLTPYDSSKTCRFYAAGYCKRGADCWFVHALPQVASSGSSVPPGAAEEEDEIDSLCCICYEKPVTYGLLGGCSHIFCLNCIRGWRDRHDKSEDVISSGVTKTCPLCRAPSKFVTPSSVLYTDSDPRKAQAIERYKASMARVPCKFFQRSPPHRRYCPFGNDCFYKHQNEDGTTYDFEQGVEYYIRQRGRYMDDHGYPLPGRQDRVSLLRSLQVAIDRFRTGLEGLAAFDDHVDDAVDADALLDTDLDALFTDDGTPLVPTSLVTALAETVMSTLAAMAGEESSLERAEAPTYPPSDAAATVGHDITHDDSPPGLVSTRGLTPSPPRTLDLYEILRRPDAIEALDEVVSTHLILDDQVQLDYSSGDEHLTIDHGAPVVPPPLVPDDSPTAQLIPPPSDSTPPDSSPEHEPPTESVSSPTPGEEAAPAVPAVVHDSDPPFMTDGRGRVVWSSTTAPRGRRSTTSTAVPGPALSQHRDKPRDGMTGDYVADRSPERRLLV